MSLEDRFSAKLRINARTGCWDWIGATQPTGYGQLWNGVRPEQAHRIAFKLFTGAIPVGCEIDHLCRNRGCVNPAHLRAVPHKENMRVSDTLMGRNAAKTFCMRGHPLSGENLILNSSGARQCRECSNMRARRAKAKRRQHGGVLF